MPHDNNSDMNLKENRLYGSSQFSCSLYQKAFSENGSLIVKHHWHEEAELLYFHGGDYHLEINMERFHIDSECIFFVNPGELHHISAKGSLKDLETAIVFDNNILKFDTVDAGEIQIISPLLGGALIYPRCIPCSHEVFPYIRGEILSVLHSANLSLNPPQPGEKMISDFPPSSQLFIKASLLKILALLSEYQLLVSRGQGYDKRVESLKSALSYIQSNYQKKIYIRDLAQLTGMNEQYFCRFFKKAIGKSPMEYLNAYRIKKSIHLLEETSLPIIDVCMESGFNNLGNFMREFRKYTDTTPLRYRKNSSS